MQPKFPESVSELAEERVGPRDCGLECGKDWLPLSPLQTTMVCLFIEALLLGHCVARSYAKNIETHAVKL